MTPVMITRVKWRVEVEWDRKINTGSYSRHDTKEEAEKELESFKSDPPARWRIFKETTTYSEIRSSNNWHKDDEL